LPRWRLLLAVPPQTSMGNGFHSLLLILLSIARLL
jgi:hypothetical protein